MNNEKNLGDVSQSLDPRSTAVSSEDGRTPPSIAIAPAHYPGPWTIGRRSSSGAYKFIDGPAWGKMVRVVVRFDGDMEDSEEGRANLNLIASAPDLLASLQEVIAYREGRPPCYFHSMPDDQHRANAMDDAWNLIERRMRAAIAKAKGTQA